MRKLCFRETSAFLEIIIGRPTNRPTDGHVGSLGRCTSNKRQQILSLWQIVDYTEKKICTLQRPSLGYLQMLAWICAYMHNCQWLFFFFHSFVFVWINCSYVTIFCLHFPFKIYAFNFMFIYLCTYNYVSFKLVLKAQIFTCPVWTRYQRIILPRHQLLHLSIYVPKINQKCTFAKYNHGKIRNSKTFHDRNRSFSEQ